MFLLVFVPTTVNDFGRRAVFLLVFGFRLAIDHFNAFTDLLRLGGMLVRLLVLNLGFQFLNHVTVLGRQIFAQCNVQVGGQFTGTGKHWINVLAMLIFGCFLTRPLYNNMVGFGFTVLSLFALFLAAKENSRGKRCS